MQDYKQWPRHFYYSDLNDRLELSSGLDRPWYSDGYNAYISQKKEDEYWLVAVTEPEAFCGEVLYYTGYRGTRKDASDFIAQKRNALYRNGYWQDGELKTYAGWLPKGA